MVLMRRTVWGFTMTERENLVKGSVSCPSDSSLGAQVNTTVHSAWLPARSLVPTVSVMCTDHLTHRMGSTPSGLWSRVCSHSHTGPKASEAGWAWSL